MKILSKSAQLFSALASVAILTVGLALPADAAGVSATAKSQIRKLFYDQNQASAASTSAFISYVKSHNYPGVVQSNSSEWASWAIKLKEVNFKKISTPDLSTIDLDPNWKWVAGNCHPAMKSKPKGTTYIVTIDQTISTDYEAPVSSKADVHVTILNGKAYFYQTICFGS